MARKGTDPAQIQAFARKGTEIFNQIEAKMGQLVDETSTADYEGQNAYDFKQKCTTNAVDFGNACTTQMQNISSVIQDSTSSITTRLGGAALTLDPPTVKVKTPAITTSTEVYAANDESLNALSSSVGTIYGEIRQLFEQNLANLRALGPSQGWEGSEYEQAVGEVSAITNNMTASIDQSQQTMQSDISNQLNALGMNG